MAAEWTVFRFLKAFNLKERSMPHHHQSSWVWRNQPSYLAETTIVRSVGSSTTKGLGMKEQPSCKAGRLFLRSRRLFASSPFVPAEVRRSRSRKLTATRRDLQGAMSFGCTWVSLLHSWSIMSNKVLNFLVPPNLAWLRGLVPLHTFLNGWILEHPAWFHEIGFCMFLHCL